MEGLPDWQIIAPYHYEQSEFHVEHFLSCGSYATTNRVEGLEVCSFYNIKKHMIFPVLKETLGSGEQTLLIVTHGSLKVDQRLQKLWEVCIDPKDIRGDETNDSQFLRLILKIKSSGKTDTGSPDVLYSSQQLSIKRLSFNQNQEFTVNDSRAFLLILSGQIKLLNDFQPLVCQNEAIHLKKSAKVRAVKATTMLVLCWLS